ncbi:Importin alpha subunit (Karyopherin alpha subunit) (Serine-rich RNA polymerase I suppressor protein) [Nowakowskiella sp. JEL0078]|nr:Importin alpha subunit (Karyopherin alpha subunit) (Serine-rich RNA polymerase I suppressor protein) [Nowakowskiella sp. JEL0078]
MVASNIAAGNIDQVQSLIESGAVKDSLTILSGNDDKRLKKEACWILSNVASSKDWRQVGYLVEEGVFESVFQYLSISYSDYQAIQKAIECLENIFEAGGENVKQNFFVEKILKEGKLDDILRAGQVVAFGPDAGLNNDFGDFEWYSDLSANPVTPRERVLVHIVKMLQRWFGAEMNAKILLQDVLSGFGAVSLG